jgi:hypothetical protein
MRHGPCGKGWRDRRGGGGGNDDKQDRYKAFV